MKVLSIALTAVLAGAVGAAAEEPTGLDRLRLACTMLDHGLEEEGTIVIYEQVQIEYADDEGVTRPISGSDLMNKHASGDISPQLVGSLRTYEGTLGEDPSHEMVQGIIDNQVPDVDVRGETLRKENRFLFGHEISEGKFITLGAYIKDLDKTVLYQNHGIDQYVYTLRCTTYFVPIASD